MVETLSGPGSSGDWQLTFVRPEELNEESHVVDTLIPTASAVSYFCVTKDEPHHESHKAGITLKPCPHTAQYL